MRQQTHSQIGGRRHLIASLHGLELIIIAYERISRAHIFEVLIGSTSALVEELFIAAIKFNPLTCLDPSDV